ncbi:MAG: glycosyltransferase [Bacteroidaceae bacterium]|nr:glycosyltransferase [Bacteroidaceae bacterium]
MDKLQPNFSIITVTFNAESFLERTILSVLEQTYPRVEYIVVDGASKDGTLAIIERYDKRISRWISEPDKGLYDAMNKGMKMATGDYLCFLNAGDMFYEPETLQKMVDSIQSQSELPDVLYGHTVLVDESGHFKRMRRLEPPEELNWKSFRQGMLVCHQAFFAKRIIAVDYDLSFRYSADQDWCIRTMKKADNLFNTHLTLIRYLEEGMSTRNRKESLNERFQIMVKHYGWFSTIVHHFWFVIRAIIKR